jgi:hypothetical protein
MWHLALSKGPVRTEIHAETVVTPQIFLFSHPGTDKFIPYRFDQRHPKYKEPTFQVKGFSYNRFLHVLNILMHNVCMCQRKKEISAYAD